MNQDAVRIIPLGGLGEIGKNMTAIEYRGKIVVLDCGVEFPSEDMLGIDLVLPDIRWLMERQQDVLAFVITHGHEDHHGALPFVLRQLNRPVYGSRFTLALIKSKLEEHGLLKSVELNEVSDKSRLQLGPFDLSFIATSHSIPDSLSIVLGTDLGAVVLTGDYRFDHTPIDGRVTDVDTFARLGEKGVLALLGDSTNAEAPWLDGLGEHRQQRLPPDLRRGRGPRDRRQLRLPHPPRPAGDHHRPPARPQVRRSPAVRWSRTSTSPATSAILKVPDGAMIKLTEIDEYRPEEILIVIDRQPGRAAVGAHAHGLRRPSSGGASTRATPWSSRPRRSPATSSASRATIDRLLKVGATVIYGERAAST